MKKQDLLKSARKAIERRWVQGLIGVVGIIITIIIGILGFTIMEKGDETATNKPEIQQDEVAPQKLSQEWSFTDLNINNTIVTNTYKQIYEQILIEHHDAKLANFFLIVYPYSEDGNFYLHFVFYSPWSDKCFTYIGFGYESGPINVRESKPAKPVEYEYERAVFSKLPWIEHTDWLGIVSLAYEKIGPLPSVPETYWSISAYPYDDTIDWLVSFQDGVTGKIYRFAWNGEGYPVQIGEDD